MLDLKFVRDNAAAVRQSQTARGEDPALVDAALAADERRRAAIAGYEELRAEQKVLGKQVASAQGDDKQALLTRTKELSARVKEAELSAREAEEQLATVQLQLSNVVEPGAPVGGEEDFTVLEHVGTPRDFAAEGFEPKDLLQATVFKNAAIDYSVRSARQKYGQELYNPKNSANYLLRLLVFYHHKAL